jgi:hypothetical protein
MSKRPYTEDELAYDGSQYRQRRALTPRERDIMCRILHDILYKIKAHATVKDDQLWIDGRTLDELQFMNPMPRAPSHYGYIRMATDEVEKLEEIIHAITPRRD